MKNAFVRFAAFFALLFASADAGAGARAWLDRDHVAVGDSIQLTIEADGSPGKPDLSGLQRDFDIQGTATGIQSSWVNGRTSASTKWSVTLVPKHRGVIDIPPIPVGNDRTPALRVGVDAAPAMAAGPPPAANAPAQSAPIFIESTIAPEHPYVGQATVYTLRLHYAVPLLGSALDEPKPDNGDLRHFGEDLRDSVMVGGHRYDVAELHYLLQPERSGNLHLSAPVFQARTMPSLSGAFDDDLGVGGAMRALGKAIDVPVRPRPDAASDPWLPATSLKLAIDPPATPPRAGEPFAVVVRLSGEGLTAAQLPEIALPPIAGAQVYPEPSSTVERAHGGALQAERTRRFAIVPERVGDLRMPELTVPWWDVTTDRAERAHAMLPVLHVLPGSGARSGAADAAPSGAAASATSDAQQGTAVPELRAWQAIAVVLAILLGLSIAWGWRRGAGGADVDGIGEAPVPAPRRAPALSQALAQGDAAAITHALIAAAHAGSPREHAPGGLLEVAARLDDPVQCAAVLAFDAARWSAQGTAGTSALDRLRDAFSRPPRWTAPARVATHAGVLPPLYPT